MISPMQQHRTNPKGAITMAIYVNLDDITNNGRALLCDLRGMAEQQGSDFSKVWMPAADLIHDVLTGIGLPEDAVTAILESQEVAA